MQISIEEKHKKTEKVSSLTAGNFSLLTNLIQTYEKKCLLNLNATKVSLQYDKFVTNS